MSRVVMASALRAGGDEIIELAVDVGGWRAQGGGVHPHSHPGCGYERHDFHATGNSKQNASAKISSPAGVSSQDFQQVSVHPVSGALSRPTHTPTGVVAWHLVSQSRKRIASNHRHGPLQDASSSAAHGSSTGSSFTWHTSTPDVVGLVVAGSSVVVGSSAEVFEAASEPALVVSGPCGPQASTHQGMSSAAEGNPITRASDRCTRRF